MIHGSTIFGSARPTTIQRMEMVRKDKIGFGRKAGFSTLGNLLHTCTGFINRRYFFFFTIKVIMTFLTTYEKVIIYVNRKILVPTYVSMSPVHVQPCVVFRSRPCESTINIELNLHPSTQQRWKELSFGSFDWNLVFVLDCIWMFKCQFLGSLGRLRTSSKYVEKVDYWRYSIHTLLHSRAGTIRESWIGIQVQNHTFWKNLESKLAVFGWKGFN